jgi:hypothetical protein
MTFEKLKTDKAVLYARLLGFEPFGQSLSAHKHFYWYMPEGEDTFSVHFHKGVPQYTVNRETSTSIEQACKWLQKIEKAA